MIPRRAVFYWDGEPMSWLRQQSIETFKALNPAWEVVVTKSEGLPLDGDDRHSRVLRSDWWRYRELHTNGGVYFDSDIVFCKPIPDSWLENDVILPFSADLGAHVGHIAVLGCEQGNSWFRLLDEACGVRVKPGVPLNYSKLGVMLLNDLFVGLEGYSVTWLDPESFIPIKWSLPEELWRDGNMLPPMSYGVHWFGGDWLSMKHEQLVNEDWALKSKCVVAKAWRKAFSQKSNAETLKEQHGF